MQVIPMPGPVQPMSATGAQAYTLPPQAAPHQTPCSFGQPPFSGQSLSMPPSRIVLPAQQLPVQQVVERAAPPPGWSSMWEALPPPPPNPPGEDGCWVWVPDDCGDIVMPSAFAQGIQQPLPQSEQLNHAQSMPTTWAGFGQPFREATLPQPEEFEATSEATALQIVSGSTHLPNTLMHTTATAREDTFPLDAQTAPSAATLSVRNSQGDIFASNATVMVGAATVPYAATHQDESDGDKARPKAFGAAWNPWASGETVSSSERPTARRTVGDIGAFISADWKTTTPASACFAGAAFAGQAHGMSGVFGRSVVEFPTNQGDNHAEIPMMPDSTSKPFSVSRMHANSGSSEIQSRLTPATGSTYGMSTTSGGDAMAVAIQVATRSQAFAHTFQDGSEANGSTPHPFGGIHGMSATFGGLGNRQPAQESVGHFASSHAGDVLADTLAPKFGSPGVAACATHPVSINSHPEPMSSSLPPTASQSQGFVPMLPPFGSQQHMTMTMPSAMQIQGTDIPGPPPFSYQAPTSTMTMPSSMQSQGPWNAATQAFSTMIQPATSSPNISSQPPFSTIIASPCALQSQGPHTPGPQLFSSLTPAMTMTSPSAMQSQGINISGPPPFSSLAPTRTMTSPTAMQSQGSGICMPFHSQVSSQGVPGPPALQTPTSTVMMTSGIQSNAMSSLSPFPSQFQTQTMMSGGPEAFTPRPATTTTPWPLPPTAMYASPPSSGIQGVSAPPPPMMTSGGYFMTMTPGMSSGLSNGPSIPDHGNRLHALDLSDDGRGFSAARASAFSHSDAFTQMRSAEGPRFDSIFDSRDGTWRADPSLHRKPVAMIAERNRRNDGYLLDVTMG